MTRENRSTIARAAVLGVGVHALDMQTTIAEMGSAIKEGRKGYICLTGAHGLVEARHNAKLKAVLEDAFLVVPDGMPTVWMGRLQGLRHMRRVYGPGLMLEAVGRRELPKWRHFLLGGDHGVAEQLRASLLARFPEASIVGTYTPPFREMTAGEEEELTECVKRAKPDIIWVGLSTPKQEFFMARFLPRLETCLMAGVGAAFLYHTGAIKDSPEWVKEAGLQWLHRLLQEPRRLWRRYFKIVPHFLFHALMQLAGMPGYEVGHACPRSSELEKSPLIPEEGSTTR